MTAESTVSPADEASKKMSHHHDDVMSTRSSRKSKHHNGSHSRNNKSKSRSKSPDDDLILSDRSPHRHISSNNKRRSSPKPRSKSTMSSSSSSSNSNKLLGLSSSDDDNGDTLTASERSPHRRKSSQKPRRSKSTDDSSDSLAMSHRSSGGRKRSSQRPRSKSTMSASSNQSNNNGDSLTVSARSSDGRRRSSQRPPRSNSTMSSSSIRSRDSLLAASERSSTSKSASSRHRSSSNDEDLLLRTSKRKARLARASAAPGAFHTSFSDDDDDDDLLGGDDAGRPSSHRQSRKGRHQSKLDKEAKRRARSLSLSSTRFGGSDSEEEQTADKDMALKLAGARYGKTAGPGAVQASNQDRNSREARKSERHSTRKSSADHNKNNIINKSKRGSSKDNADEIAKRRSKHSKRASMPGAAAQSVSIDMAARKQQRQHASMVDSNNNSSELDEEQLAMKLAGARYRGKNSIGTRMQTSSASNRKETNAKGDDGLIEAVVVDGSNDDVVGDTSAEGSNSAMMRSSQMMMTEGDIEDHRRRVQEQNENNRREMEADVKRKADEKRKKRNRNLAILFILLAITGVGIYFLLQAKPWSSSAAATVPEDNEELVVASDAPSASTMDEEPSDTPSGPPTIYLKYDPPDAQDCENIAAGIPIDMPNEDAVFTRNFDLITEVDLDNDEDLEPVLPRLETKIEQILMPRLAGCPDDSGEEVTERRMQVTAQNIRNVIADGLVTVSLSEDLECKSILPNDNCSVVLVNLDLRLLGNELVLYIVGIISDVFHVDSPTPLVTVLDLNSPYVQVLVVEVANNDPTPAPTTGSPSESPSELPSSLPSSEPSLLPSTFPSIAPFPGSTPSPTCASIATSFDSQSFLERSGTQDASTFTVPCSTNAATSNMVVLRRLTSSCEVDCVADLAFTTFEQVCNQESFVDVTLTGDYSESTLFIGILDSGASYLCSETLQLETQSPSQTPSKLPTQFPTIATSEVPTLFPTQTPTLIPVLDESSAPTIGDSMQPSLFPSSAPTSRYVGCFQDSDEHDFFLYHHSFFSSQFENIDSCINACATFGFSYAGLQFEDGVGHQCYCGNSFGLYGGSTSCFQNAVCGGECGGTLVNSVYSTNIQQGSPEQELPEGLECGCYNDDHEERDLPYEYKYGHPDLPYEFGYGESMSQQACIIGCQLRGYPFAGLSRGGKCWCGDDAGTHGEADPEDEGSCSMECSSKGTAACYGDGEWCDCGGLTNNRVFRTSLSVECPSFESEAPTVAPVPAPSTTPTLSSEPSKAPIPPPSESPTLSPPENLIVPGEAYPYISSSDFQGSEWYAIDGDTCEGTQQQCMPTMTSFQSSPTTGPPWWELDLGSTSSVYIVRVWQGNFQGVVFPLDGVMLELLDESGETVIESSEISMGEDQYVEFNYEDGIEGVQFVRLQGQVSQMVLGIAEVELLGYQDS